jgi:hypothetical protein
MPLFLNVRDCCFKKIIAGFVALLIFVMDGNVSLEAAHWRTLNAGMLCGGTIRTAVNRCLHLFRKAWNCRKK